MSLPAYNPSAVPGDIDYRPGPDWPPSLNELRAFRAGQSEPPRALPTMGVRGLALAGVLSLAVWTAIGLIVWRLLMSDDHGGMELVAVLMGVLYGFAIGGVLVALFAWWIL